MNELDHNRRDDIVRKAGRGVLSITASKLYFIVMGYVVALALPRLLGSPAAFGLYSATITSISVLNNVLNIATIQTVSKRVSENLDRASITLNQGLRLQLLIGCVLGGAMFLGAPILAEDVLLDPLMVPFFRVVSVVLLSNALYAALIGYLNGRQLFQRQAALDMTYTTLRSACIIGASALGFGVIGALSGFSCSVVTVLFVALVLVGVGQPGKSLPWKRWFSFMAPLWIYHLSLNLILMVDIIVLKRTVTSMALQAHKTQVIAAEIASEFAGFYKAAQTFAFVPYQLLLPVTFVVFPMISKAISDNDDSSTRDTIRQALRFSLLTCLAMASPIAGAASGVMRLAYPEAYLAGSGALSVLTIGIACFALFVIASTLLSGAGHPTKAALIGVVSLSVVVIGNVTLLYLVGIGDRTLIAAATGTSLGTGVALVAVGIALHRSLGASVPLLTFCRGIIAGLVGFTVAHFIPSHTRSLSLLALIAGASAYLVTLIVLREIGRAEIATIKRIVGKKQA
jgi:stage V sporulation protein B